MLVAGPADRYWGSEASTAHSAYSGFLHEMGKQVIMPNLNKEALHEKKNLTTKEKQPARSEVWATQHSAAAILII